MPQERSWGILGLSRGIPVDITPDSVKHLSENDMDELLKFAEFLADRKAYKEGRCWPEPSRTITILKDEQERRKTNAN